MILRQEAPMRLVLLVVLLALAGACGGRAVGDTQCQEFCSAVRDDLMQYFAIPPERVDCDQAKWREAKTCEACEAIFKLEFEVQPIGLCDDWR
jgi:hypothetical protein